MSFNCLNFWCMSTCYQIARQAYRFHFQLFSQLLYTSFLSHLEWQIIMDLYLCLWVTITYINNTQLLWILLPVHLTMHNECTHNTKSIGTDTKHTHKSMQWLSLIIVEIYRKERQTIHDNTIIPLKIRHINFGILIF